MPSKLDEKKRELHIKKREVVLLEEEIAKLNINERGTIADQFPTQATVILIGKSEKYRLRQKKATVIGHTTCFVRLRRKEEEFLRSPENLLLSKYDEPKKESRRGKRISRDHTDLRDK